MAFRVGQKVVCVDASIPDASQLSVPIIKKNGLVEGSIYTIAQVGVTHPFDPRKLPCVFVDEICLRMPLWAHRFRPVVERKTDISVFTAMLTGSKIGADA